VTSCPLEKAVASHQTRENRFHYLYGIFIGIAVALGILHLLFDLFVCDRRSGHFDYAVFTLCTASLSATIIGRSGADTVAQAEMWGRGFLLALVLVSTFGFRFFSLMANGPFGWERKAALVVGGGLALLTPWLTVPVVYGFVTLALTADIWWVTRVVRKGHPDRWILLAGMVACFLGATLQMGHHLLGLGSLSDVTYIYGFVVLLFAMSIHLARSVGRTHEALAHQVDEVKKLSAASLAQEQQARDEALQRAALEAENRQQAERLVEAERRSELMGELESTNRELRTTQAQLVQTEKMASLGQLVAGVAHEMNTPIGAIRSVHGSLISAVAKIRGRVSALAPEALEDKKLAKALDVLDDGAGVISRGSERVSEIVQRLRTFARLDEAEMQRVDVHEGLEDTLVLARHELKHGIEVIRDFQATEPIACFPGQLNQVFLNLVINARQAMGAKGTLTLRTRDGADGLEIEVEDDGPGIPPDNLARVFDPGFTTKGVGVGTGLGLAICFRIIEAHHGRLEVESPPGRGALFRIWLPRDLESRL
ncbi:MAG: ATP-binding protein, partial [Myxococcota bacterium]